MGPKPIDRASVATRRFGLGPRPGETATAAPDPSAWLLAQLVPQAGADGPATVDLLLDAADDELPDDPTARRAARKANRKEAKQVFQEEIVRRALHRIASPAPFYERLVSFWSEHFTVSIRQRRIVRFACAFEREAIRPHVLGRFGDMLRAVTQHPAMLVYLDNHRSIGPNSPTGAKAEGAGKNRGLNENLAREILELHTLGVHGGYAQADVGALARLITGWTYVRDTDTVGPSGPHGFRFVARAHEPGPKTMLGVTYDQGGKSEGELALAALGRHPATARHIAEKLATHFVSDTPTESSIYALERCFRDTDGDLSALARALVDLDEVWTASGSKLRDPEDWFTAMGRAVALDSLATEPKAAPFFEKIPRVLEDLGHLPFSAPSPDGYTDLAAPNAGGEALLRRIELAGRVAARVRGRVPDAVALAVDLWGSALSPRTLEALRGAGDRVEALALLLCAPEAMRR